MTSMAWRYWLSFLLALLTLALLPVLCAAALAIPLWGLHLWTAHMAFRVPHGFHYRHYPLFSGLFIRLLVCLFLVLVELALLVSLIKPLLARRSLRSAAVPLDPALQPAFYDFVSRIAEWLGVPAPQAIEVDCGLNASLRLGHGLWSAFSRKPALRIGLPLIAALSARELAGLIAHELRHVRQGALLRLCFLLSRVHAWLSRSSDEKDSWDTWIDRQSFSATMLEIALFANRCSRWITQVLLFPTRCATSFLVREMERDADLYEIRLAGSAAFESGTGRLAILAEALDRASKEARGTWSLGRHLPDNYPAYVLLHEAKLPVAMRDLIMGRLLRRKTRLFDSHPSPRERILRARAAQEPGIFEGEVAASGLIAEFDALAKRTTFSHYVLDLRLNLDSANLRPVAAGQIHQ
jgi:Zn-dependent protease with chaperone function